MRFTIAVLVLAALYVGSLGLAANDQIKPFLGKWDIAGIAPHTDYVYWLEVKQEANGISGMFLNRGGSVSKLPMIVFENGELVFSPDKEKKQIHRAKVIEGKLTGSVEGLKEPVKWVGVRPPKWVKYNANGAHQFGKPVELFDGKTLAAWDVQFKNKAMGWSVVDGLMQNQKSANNLVSKEKFQDYKISMEYKLEEKSNSGIYMRGRYELQVLDDHGKPAESHGHMGIYSRVAPAVNASKPAGEWQSMEATIVGNRITVQLNGQKVHDNQEIEGITGGALDSDEGAPGPVMIQGDHGRIWIRKVTVIPIVKTES